MTSKKITLAGYPGVLTEHADGTASFRYAKGTITGSRSELEPMLHELRAQEERRTGGTAGSLARRYDGRHDGARKALPDAAGCPGR